MYYYNIRVDNIEEHKKCFIILSGKETLILKELNDRNLNKILDIATKISYPIILNKMNDRITKINEKEYLMFKLINPSKRIEKLETNILEVEYENNVEKVWENNINFYINYAKNNNLKTNKQIYYYIGMAENALSIYNYRLNFFEKERNAICHTRINYPLYYINYYDPTEIIIDSVTRDYAEYIKSKFFNDSITVDEVFKIINNLNFNKREICIFIARLMYPTYYFDNFIENNKRLERIIKKSNEYNDFIGKILNKFKTYNFSININWIL